MANLEIYLLLLLAVIAGWALGFYGSRRRQKRSRNTESIFQDYFVGLNYLLNDEPDEAIDTFIKALEINSETIETHLALGALLRRRGKVDKAITVHQALLARPGLSQEFADSTRIQLAIDYITAGLLDRAERLLHEILNEGSAAKWEALQHLITIYQTEKEWEQAIACSEQLLDNASFKRDAEIRNSTAHYCCELSEKYIRESQLSKGRDLAKKALTFARENIRATLLLATIEKNMGNVKSALKEYQRIASNRPEYMDQVVGPLVECFERLGQANEVEDYLRTVSHDHPHSSAVLEIANRVKQREGLSEAIKYLQTSVANKPNIEELVTLLQFQISNQLPVGVDSLRLFYAYLQEQLARKPGYRCSHCGYESRNLYWQCPSCQHWGRNKPVLGGSVE